MVGGDDEAVRRRAGLPHARARGRLRPLGPTGAGHFVKMVHNGIEYGLMQAYAEGFEIMRALRVRPRPARDRRLWRYGSSCVPGCSTCCIAAFEQDGSDLESIEGFVQDSGEGRWTVERRSTRTCPRR